MDVGTAGIVLLLKRKHFHLVLACRHLSYHPIWTSSLSPPKPPVPFLLPSPPLLCQSSRLSWWPPNSRVPSRFVVQPSKISIVRQLHDPSLCPCTGLKITQAPHMDADTQITVSKQSWARHSLISPPCVRVPLCFLKRNIHETNTTL